MTVYHCERAWLPEGVAAQVRVSVEGARITAVERGPAEAGDTRLRGLVLPGFANAHSHAFHRALRGRTHTGAHGATFWTWREQMYQFADALDPDSYRALATAVFTEMALAGITTVGEFHYLHHDRGGRRYADPHAMSRALAEAAELAGIRLTLLDTCYLTGGIDAPLSPVQQRFSDGDAAAWAERVADSRAALPGVVVGMAVHSVRAVPREQLPAVAEASAHAPVTHAHVSEQPAENAECLAAYGATPAALLADAGVLNERATAVHATHLSAGDIAAVAASGSAVCLCPTTERDLADGIGPAAALHEAGVELVLGSDQHAVIDMFAEQHAAEMHERLASGRRGTFSPAQLMTMATTAGHRRLGVPDAGQIAVGSRADLVAVDLTSSRTAGCDPQQIAFAAAAADVRTVVVDGRSIVTDGQHSRGDVGPMLAAVLAALEGAR